ncbi:MAG: hypothetical protein PHS67_07950, partial [Sphaerochaetaceae bacterium]|nr:hypothetical protein [Sphaerochaetaceae bacterium]
NKGVQQSDSVSVDLKANGSDGPISVAHNDTQIELTWSSENAIQCETFGDWTNRLQPINGQMLVDLSKLWLFNTGEKKYTFTITCRGSGGQAVTDSIVVTKSAKVYDPVSVDLKINGSDGPVDIANNIKGIELTWSSENASSCSTSGHWGSSNRPVNGQMTKDLSNTYGKIIVGTGIIQYTFTITCTNFAGTATDTVVVNKLPEAYGSIAVDIKANGSDGPVDAIYDSTESVKITWSSENATNCSASGDMPIWVPYTGTHGGVSVIRVKRDYTFTITCTNPNGSTATDSVVVRVGTPTVDLKINGSDGPINVLVDSEINIAWASVGASACSWQPGVWFTPTTGSKKEKIRDAKTYTYTITCRNTRGTSSDTVVVNGVSSLGLEPNLKMGPEFSSSISSENLENQLASLADIVSKIAQQIKDMLK